MSGSRQDLPGAGRRPRDRFFVFIMSLAMVGPMVGLSAIQPSPALAVTSADGAHSTIGADQGSLSAGGTATITVQAQDSSGPMSTGGDSVILSADHGTLSTVIDNHDGTYTATLSDTVAETDTVSGTINGDPITTGDAQVTFTPGAANAGKSTITAGASEVSVDSGSTNLTVQAKDEYGNNRTKGGDAVTLSADNGTLSTVIDNNNGTYSATLSDTTAETDTVSGTINTNPITSGNAQVKFTPGVANASKTTISAASSVSVDDSPTTVTVQAKDQYGNNLTTGGDTVTLSANNGIGALTVTDVGDGTYTAPLGDHTTRTDIVSGTINSSAITSGDKSVVFTPGALDHFTIDTIGAQTAGGAFTVTVTAYDQYGNVKNDYHGTATLSGLADSPGCTNCVPVLNATPGSYGNPGSWTNGVGTYSVTAFNAQTGAQLKVADGSVSKLSNTFTVSPANALAGFTVTNIGTQTAGGGFSVTVTAYDLYGNVNTNYQGGAAALSGLASSPGCSTCAPHLTATPATYGSALWSNGVGTFSGVLAYKAETGAQLTVTDGSVSNVSNPFAVNPAIALKGFTIATIGTQTAGNGFAVTVTAFDLYGNVNTNYTGGATLAGLAPSPGCTGCTPQLSATSATYGTAGSWTSGISTFTGVLAYNAQGNAQVTASDGSVSNHSNSFVVNPAATLQGLTISTVGGQTAGASFTVTVQAYDLYGNLNSNITSGVALSGLAASPGCSNADCTPGISALPAVYGSASWSGGIGTFTGVNAYNSQAGAQLTATGTGSISNVSNTFAVNPSTTSQLVFSDSNVGFNGQPIDTKFGQPINSFCNASGAVAPNPCAAAPPLPPESSSTSSATKVLAIDQFGNRVSGISVTVGTSPGTTLLGTKTMSTQGGTLGVAPFGEAWFNTLSIAATSTYQLTATKPSPTVNGISGKFRVVQALQACSGSHQCQNNTGNGKSGNFTQYSYGQITSTGTYSNVLLTTQFTLGSDTSNQCGTNKTIGDSTELRAAGPSVTTTSTGYLIIIIPKNTLKADGVLSRGTPSFNICLGTINLGGGVYGTYGSNTAPAWMGKKSTGGLTSATYRPDANLGVNMWRAWATPADCGTAGLSATDPCIYLRTKQKSAITALVTQGILGVGADANMNDSDLAIVIKKPYPWDGKGGMY